MQLAPFKIWATRDGKLVKDGDESAAVLVVAAGLPITPYIRERYDFGAILNPIPEGRSQEEGASPADEAAPASAPPEGEEEPETEPGEQPSPPKSRKRGNA